MPGRARQGRPAPSRLWKAKALPRAPLLESPYTPLRPQPMLKISNQVSIPDEEIEISAVRSQGAGGQNVNKVSSAIHLRFDIRASSLPEDIKRRLLTLHDRRISKQGVIVIKAQEHREQHRNRETALARLTELIRRAQQRPKPRIPTRPTRAARERRLQAKKRRGAHKRLRGRVQLEA